MVKKYHIERAYVDNVKLHKIGETNGFTAEQAADLGFDTYERAVEISHNLGAAVTSNSSELISPENAGIIDQVDTLRARQPAKTPSQLDELIRLQQERYGGK